MPPGEMLDAGAYARALARVTPELRAVAAGMVADLMGGGMSAEQARGVVLRALLSGAPSADGKRAHGDG